MFIFTRTCWRCDKDYRNGGLGRRLKLLQREDALARGIELIEWTFDPLEIKNAYLNIEKLGAISRRYNINQYGITSSPLQGGLAQRPLDRRMVVEVEAGGDFAGDGKDSGIRQRSRRSKFPRRFMSGRLRQKRAARRKQVQERNREQFLEAFRSRAWRCLGYERDEAGNGKFLLGEWNEKWSYASRE